METLAKLIIYITILLLYVYYAKRYMRKNCFPGAYNGFVLGCILYYVIVPIILVIFRQHYLAQAGDWRYAQLLKFIYGANVSFYDVLLTTGGLLVGLIGLNFGYRIKRRFMHQKSTTSLIIGLDKGFISVIRRIGFVSLMLGGFSVLMYISAFGGINNALKLAEALRQHNSSMADFGMSGFYSYFLILSGVLTVTPLLFYLAWKECGKQFDLLCTIAAFVLDILYLLINSGKSAILRLGIIIFYMYLHEHKVRRKGIWFAVAILIGLPVMDVLDILFIQGNIFEAIKNFSYLHLVRSFAVPTELNYNMNDIVHQYGYFYFKPFITDFFNILPGLQFEATFINTSEFVRGVNWKNLGGTPNDVLTYGFLQLRYIGIFIVWTLWGMISGWLDNMIEKIGNNRGRHMLAITAGMNMFSVITCADISSTLLYNLSFIFVAFVLWMYNKKSRRIHIKQGDH